MRMFVTTFVLIVIFFSALVALTGRPGMGDMGDTGGRRGAADRGAESWKPGEVGERSCSSASSRGLGTGGNGQRTVTLRAGGVGSAGGVGFWPGMGGRLRGLRSGFEEGGVGKAVTIGGRARGCG